MYRFQAIWNSLLFNKNKNIGWDIWVKKPRFLFWKHPLEAILICCLTDSVKLIFLKFFAASAVPLAILCLASNRPEMRVVYVYFPIPRQSRKVIVKS